MNRKLDKTNFQINLSGLIDDAVSNTMEQQYQALNLQEAERIVGGASEPRILFQLYITEKIWIKIFDPSDLF